MKHAELFAGYGGLGLAVEAAFNAELAWYSEWEDAPSKVMDRHWPGVPNHGDVTTVDWSAVEPVDIISGGSPCQDVSAAGRRAGMTDGTRSNLWVAMREAIAQIRPRYVIWENVRGAHSAAAYSAVESEPGLLGDDRAAYLRATGRVLGDLANLGYDAQWRTISAASIGAPHRRERVFVLAWRRDAPAEDRDGRRARRGTATPGQSGRGGQDTPARLPSSSPGGTGPAAEVALLPTPVAQPSGNSPEDHLRKKPGREIVTDLAILLENGLLETGGKLLPTPNAYLMSKGGSQHPDKVRAGGHMVDLADVVEHILLPTPKAGDADFGLPRTSGRPPERSTHLATRLHYTDFGTYTAAIRRWEQALGRPAPPPTELSPRGKHRLSEHFTEWMMGLPAGWICDTEGITRKDAIKMAGNGVVPQQAYAALADMLLTY